MDEQGGATSIQQALNRDSVMMMFHSPTVSDFSSSIKGSPDNTIVGPGSEQHSQQLLEQQAQQNTLLKYFFKGNYHAPLNKQELGSILDVGCGVGLWMKDMALEFPLTEIHGIDLNVPNRRRRTRTAAPRATSLSPTADSFSAVKTEQHSSLQNNNFSGAQSGAALPMPDAMPSNCFFHKADITQGLPFPDNTFDYCHVRLVLWGYQLNCFPDLLNELIRVTKTAGWIEFVDMDPCILKATETGTFINEWIKTGLIHSNMDPDLVKTLPKFLQEFCEDTVKASLPSTPALSQRTSRSSLVLPSQPYGLGNLKVSKISLPFGPWGGRVGELWQQTFTTFLKGLEPMMIEATLSGLVIDQYHRQCQLEMQQVIDASNRRSFEGDDRRRSRPSSFDQRMCTHKAWYNLIHQLVRDASLPTAGQSSTTSSIKEMRSYNNLYIAYAQKADLVELKQQALLRQLEQEILSPNPNMASSSMFDLASVATFGAIQPRQKTQNRARGQMQNPGAQSPIIEDPKPLDVTEDLSESPVRTRRLASSLRAKLSSPNLHQQYVTGAASPLEDTRRDDNDGSFNAGSRNRHGEVASLTQDALETFNRTQDLDQAVSTAAMSTSVSAAPPAPASIAALSIRSSSRNSNHIASVSGTAITGQPAVGTPGSVTSASGQHSPRVVAAALRRQESAHSGLGSPQPQVQLNEGKQFAEPDYFNQTPSFYPSTYYQQQQQHQQHQQQLTTVVRKSSSLSQILTRDNGATASQGVAVAGAALTATAATTVVLTGRSEKKYSDDDGKLAAHADLEQMDSSQNRFENGFLSSPVLEPVHFTKDSKIEDLNLEQEEPSAPSDTERQATSEITELKSTNQADFHESDILIGLHKDNEDNFEQDTHSPENTVDTATDARDDVSESEILMCLQEDDFEDGLDVLAADSHTTKAPAASTLEQHRENDSVVNESDVLIALQEDNEDDFEEELQILAINTHGHEGTVGMVPEHQVSSLVVRPADHLVPVRSSQALVEHASDELTSGRDAEGDDTIQIINGISLSHNVQDSDSDNDANESHLQMLPTSDDEAFMDFPERPTKPSQP
ncbi:hypothetical protein BGZ98_003607 [Dissophora globulifera]|nr:hypothetical protein BGZ98_003607 [Dissophora globulifera]